ncbi:30S ribosomal protein S10 [Mycoplasmopsis agassizii]|uniref:Small ribosomal subunit protein uS10 n=1 Tax=Mycoplasmopsis agassizii TaxID=33922 RepID=A0A1W1X387_9BACT|nr:30S ribosomal protein S10 [Mycoplasmopsis agassizii]PAF55407.1 30S ribosomal protein S10 [Mycoplasmopsis agassizii]PAK21655.1 30S ribosomal protein S10 [Mycoplasmopsis agassizii]SMC18303.1 small subunit ribosomal protein S10 [Mycoplasmopsis agassizii]
MSKIAVKLRSFEHQLVDQATKKVIILADKNNVKFSGPVPLPTKREVFTILRSVHVNKKSREQFERRTFKRLFIFENVDKKFIELLNHLEMPAGVSLELKVK